MPDNLSQFIGDNAHITTGDLIETARRAAERAGRLIATSPRPGKFGVKAHRFELDDNHYLWIAAQGIREVRIIISKPDMLHGEFSGDGALTLVDDQDTVYALVA